MLRYDGEVTGVSYIVTGEGRNMNVKAYVAFTADDNVRVGMPVIIYAVSAAENTEPAETAAPADADEPGAADHD